MSTDRQQDAGLDRLLRAALESDAPTSGGVCPEADVVAAYAEGGLTERERAALEPHLASCARCQAILAVMARDAADVAEPGKAPAWRAWFPAPWLRWLVPASAAAIALLLYVAVKPEPTTEEARSSASAAAPAPAPEGTMAKRSDQAVSQRAGKTGPAQADSEAAPGTPAARENATVPSVIASPPFLPAPVSPPAAPILIGVAPAPSTPARSTPNEAVQPSDALGASARAATANRSAIAVAEARARRDVADSAAGTAQAPLAAGAAVRTHVEVSEHGFTPGESSLNELWDFSDLVVLARAGLTGKAFVAKKPSRQPLTKNVGPTVPTGFDIVDVFKRKDSVPPNAHLTMWRLGGEAEGEGTIHRVPDDEWVRIQPGEECVLFLILRRDGEQPDTFEPAFALRGIYRLDGDRVFIGSSKRPEDALSTRELLARLRQLAGTARR